MPDFLLELRCEEIPARMQAGARADLEKLFRKELGEAGVLRQAQDDRDFDITVWSTPRRLALIARGLPESTEAVREETKGPRVGAPAQALEGFARRAGLSADQLEARDGVYYAVVEKPGRAVKDVLAEAIPAIVRAFPWPKSMRWGAASIATDAPRWVRPLSGIVAIFGIELVPCQVGEVVAGYMTLGHRFHHPGPITIGGADDYQEKLRACHVIVDHAERQDLIRADAGLQASDVGLSLVEDEGLVIENAGLTEWPQALLGQFDAAFLDVPPEVIQLTARVNQKYFVAEKDGRLANFFVCVANIDSSDPAAVVDGNRKVLAARLSDARFFWEQDRKTKLEDHAKKLARITFHEKLGTVADKVERVAKLARWLVEEGIVPPQNGEGDHAKHGGGAGGASLPSDQRSGQSDVPRHHPAGGPPPRSGEELASLAEQAARLCKADLVTEMVGEFPELQGLMGGYYARAEGLPDEVADAIRYHYKPVGQGDDVPTAPVTVAVSLADKLDTLAGFFEMNERPTGSKDPFALRRAALGVLQTVGENGLRFGLLSALAVAVRQVAHQMHVVDRRQHDVALAKGRDAGLIGPALRMGEMTAITSRAGFGEVQHERSTWDLLNFFADRLKVQQREAGVRHDLIDAVFALGGEDDLVRLLARVQALQAFVGTEDGANLLAGYKRAANILKKEGHTQDGHPGLVPGSGVPSGAADGSTAPEHVRGDQPEQVRADPPKKSLSYTPESAEQSLIDALDSAEPRAAAAVEVEDFAAAMAALASLRAPIDSFFDSVTVNDPDPAKRAARLDLLARFRAAVHNVADFSKIEG